MSVGRPAPGLGDVGLVGHTGFVGGNVLRQVPGAATYHRANLHELDGRDFSLLWICGAPGSKWLADADPEADAANLAALAARLRTARAGTAVLVSTVDVYPSPTEVDETTTVSPQDHPSAYGRNRLTLEHAVRDLFARLLVVRLPALFGPGLKKNLVFDLLHARPEFTHRESVFQYYDLRRLTRDVRTALDAGLSTLNLVTEPVTAQDVARVVAGRQLTREDGTPAAYDVRTRHAAVFGAPGRHYVLGRGAVLDGLASWVAEERAAA